MFGTAVIVIGSVFLLILIFKSARVVPQRSELVIERLGKYNRTLGAGFHLLIPFLDTLLPIEEV